MRENNVGLTAAQTTEAMKNARRDRFKLAQEFIGVELKVENVDETTYSNGDKGYTMVLRSADGKKHNFPFSYFRDGRVVSKSELKAKDLTPFKNVWLETEAEAIINNSDLVSKIEGIEAGKDYKFPSSIKVKGVVVPQHQISKKPLRSIRNYKEIDVVAAYYKENGKPYPNLTQFEAELKKSKADGRIPGLNPAIMELETAEGVKDSDLWSYRLNFVFEDIAD
jgi:hypothetical protein